MAEIEINDLASIGNIRDVPAYMLPPEAFSEATNIRFYNDGVESLGGRAQIFGTPGVAPHFAIPVSDASQTYWLYVSLTKAYVYDGAVHTNITRQSAAVDVDYTPAFTREWNGTLFGGIPILNNGNDLPQYWPSINIATKLANLTNWPSTMRAKVVRALGPYLIGFNITDSGTNYPHLVHWSHPADPGSIPSSWDHTDPTVDAGRKDLPDVNAGIIQEALPLGGKMFIYKEASTWRMTPAGGTFIFDFTTFLETSGILAPRCVTVTGDGLKHVVASQDDILVHNGSSAESLLTKRYKKYLFNQLDTTNYINSFMFTNPFFNEIWFCYPESGQTHPNRALIWSYAEGRMGAMSEAEVNFRNAAQGVIEEATTDLWSNVVPTWANYVGPWSASNRRKVVLCGTDDTKFFEMDSGTTFDGEAISALISRENISVVGRKRDGGWIVDYTKMKAVRRLWIKASGGPINVRIGFARLPGGSITWTASQEFDPTTMNYLDFVGTGQGVSVEFTSETPFRIDGYKLEGEITGRF